MADRVFIVEVDDMPNGVQDHVVRAALATTLSGLGRRVRPKWNQKQPQVRVSGGTTKIMTQKKLNELRATTEQPRYEMNDVG